MRSYLENLASDLLRLEVNTIIKDDLTCEKPLFYRRLLFELAKDYRIKIGEFETWLENKKPPTLNEEVKGFKHYFGGMNSFIELRDRAKAVAERYHDVILMSENEDYCKQLRGKQTMLDRIQKQSQTIIALFDKLKTHTASTEDWNNDYNEDENHFGSITINETKRRRFQRHRPALRKEVWQGLSREDQLAWDQVSDQGKFVIMFAYKGANETNTKQQANMMETQENDNKDFQEFEDAHQGDLFPTHKDSNVLVNAAMSRQTSPSTQGDI